MGKRFIYLFMTMLTIRCKFLGFFISPILIFVCFRAEDQVMTIYPADVVLVEGILIFVLPEICEIFNMKLFVDSDSDSRLARIGLC